MFPPTSTAGSAAWYSAPMSRVVVVFPLLPVTPTTGRRQVSKTRFDSVVSGMPRSRASRRNGLSSFTAGPTTTRSAPAMSSSRCSPST